MFNFLKKKPAPIEIDPLVRLYDAVDALNTALKEVQKNEEYRKMRPYVTAYNASTRVAGQVVLGYWSGEDRQFKITYDGRRMLVWVGDNQG